MGMWDLLSCTTETVKRYTPGVTSIKSAGVASYGFCASIIDSVVRVSGIQKLHECMPDGYRRAQIGSFAGKFAKNAAVYGFHEGYKLIPGGKAVSKIVSMTANDMKSEKRLSDIETALSKSDRETAKALSKENKAMKSTPENTPIADLVRDRKPEDVLRVFMMSEFIGARILDDLIVPGTKKSK
ncbi:hypothetical protein LIER_23300 [Lithospermum erythrorhizon]|uniref:Uncharacterized protein n=1 Tax=Lithospermum erythrorhizon TaxID=34254 RepID=A0AAV3QZ81_LITER